MPILMIIYAFNSRETSTYFHDNIGISQLRNHSHVSSKYVYLQIQKHVVIFHYDKRISQ